MATKIKLEALENRIKNLEDNETFLKDIIASQNKLLKSFIHEDKDAPSLENPNNTSIEKQKDASLTKNNQGISMRRRGTIA